MFDIFEYIEPLEKILRFYKPRLDTLAYKKIYDQMRDLGYSSHNSMLVLGSVTIYILWWILKVFLLPFIKVLSIAFKSDKLQMLYLKMKKNLFWG